MGPLIKLLGFDESIIMALISIFNREPKGWQILAHKLAKKRVSGSELMQKLLNMINWRKFQDMAVNNQILQDPMKLIK